MIFHDPGNRAHHTYVWRDEQYHLLSDPEPLVVLISDTVSKGVPYSSLAEAEESLWETVVTTILAARTYLDPYAAWPGVELAVVPDPLSGKAHLVERVRGRCRAWCVNGPPVALLAFYGRLRLLLPAEDREAA
ncbi:hypothetical protein [Sphaerimonospora thailandensis]|uniref:Uncharacterized protein n=1 Tax=Sphaerimonospora thailandensis TaxID=795644 RepID=A0A8J3REA1_9ACTN|nr:hypothetical protein [Sphaerimonospora thailandensis]GIH73110.1 hypothetical protein Mth01_53630 [Sphaerimonospora thailandensis]